MSESHDDEKSVVDPLTVRDVIDAIDFEIARQREQHLRLGWTRWALWGFLAMCFWTFLDYAGQITAGQQWVLLSVGTLSVYHAIYLFLEFNRLLHLSSSRLDEHEETRFIDVREKLLPHRLGLTIERSISVVMLLLSLYLARITPLWVSTPTVVASALWVLGIFFTYHALINSKVPLPRGVSNRYRLGRVKRLSTWILRLSQIGVVGSSAIYCSTDIEMPALRAIVLISAVMIGLLVLLQESVKSHTLTCLEDLRSDVGRRQTDPSLAMLMLQGEIEGDSLHVLVANEWKAMLDAAEHAGNLLSALEQSLSVLYSTYPTRPVASDAATDNLLVALEKAVAADSAAHDASAKDLVHKYNRLESALAHLQHTNADDLAANDYKRRYDSIVCRLRDRFESAKLRYQGWEAGK